MSKLWMAIGTLVLLGAVAVGVWRKNQTQAKEDAVWAEDQKVVILKGLAVCEQSDASLAATYAMATTHLASKAAVDRKATIRLIRETIRPVLDSRETICSGVVTLATNLLAKHPDDELRTARDQSQAHLARLRKAGSTLDRLQAALAGSTSAAEVGKLVTSAATPPP